MLGLEAPNYTIVDFVENYFGAATAELARALVAGTASFDEGDFLGLLADQSPYNAGPELVPGELRPVVAHSIEDVAAGGVQLRPHLLDARPNEDKFAFALDVRSLLLYAHRVTISAPFAQDLTLHGARSDDVRLVSNSSYPNHVNVGDGLAMVCALAPLIRGGVVFVAPPIEAPNSDDVAQAESALRSLLPEMALRVRASQSIGASDQVDLFQRCLTLAERHLRQEDLLHSLKARATRLLSCAAESVALPILKSLQREGIPPHGDPWTLSELMRLHLQGAGSIKLKDMVAIRDDDAFSLFRRDMAEAVAASASAVSNGDEALQAVVIADEMRGSAARLDLKTRRSVALSATLGDAVSWAVGAAVGASIDGWRGAAVGLAAKGATDLLKDGPTSSRRALRNHYVELSKPVRNAKEPSARERLMTARRRKSIE